MDYHSSIAVVGDIRLKSALPKINSAYTFFLKNDSVELNEFMQEGTIASRIISPRSLGDNHIEELILLYDIKASERNLIWDYFVGHGFNSDGIGSNLHQLVEPELFLSNA